MIKFLTSNLGHYHKVNGEKVPNQIDDTNGLVGQIKKYIKGNKCILFICADSKDYQKVDNYSSLLFESLKLSGIEFSVYHTLDERNKERAEELISMADFIFLSGGDTYLQNKFFTEIKLKDILKSYDGVLMGQSAGSINMASSVFNSPEDMEESEPIYFEGLGVTDINVEPHFVLSEEDFDDKEIYQRRFIIEESNNRDIYALKDGSHILVDGERIVICGESYLIKDEIITKLCEDQKSLEISSVPVLK